MPDFAEKSPRSRKAHDASAARTDAPRAAVTRRRPPNAADRAMQRQHLRTVSRRPETTQILNRLPDAVVSFDRDWCYVFMNRQAELNHQCRPGEFLGRCVWDLFPEGLQLESYQRYTRAMERQEEDVFDEYLPMFGRWFEQRLFPSPDGLTVIARDITDWLVVNEQRRRLESALAALGSDPARGNPAAAGDEASAANDDASDVAPARNAEPAAAVLGEPAGQPLRVFATFFPRSGAREEMIERFRGSDSFVTAVRDAGAITVELQVADDPNGPLVVTALWGSVADYESWQVNPIRAVVLGDISPLIEEVCIEKYEVVRLSGAQRDL